MYMETAIVRDGDVQQQAMFSYLSLKDANAPGPSAQADPEDSESSVGRTVRRALGHVFTEGTSFHSSGGTDSSLMKNQ